MVYKIPLNYFGYELMTLEVLGLLLDYDVLLKPAELQPKTDILLCNQHPHLSRR